MGGGLEDASSKLGTRIPPIAGPIAAVAAHLTGALLEISSAETLAGLKPGAYKIFRTRYCGGLVSLGLSVSESGSATRAVPILMVEPKRW